MNSANLYSHNSNVKMYKKLKPSLIYYKKKDKSPVEISTGELFQEIIKELI